MIAAYQRISRADGDLGKDGKDKSNSIENQKELILRYISCKESLQNVPVMDFVDDGYTGSNFDRPGFKAEESVQSVVPGTVRAAAEQAENFLHGTRLTAGMVSAFIENVFVHDGGRIVVRFKYEQSIQDTVKALQTG